MLIYNYEGSENTVILHRLMDTKTISTKWFYHSVIGTNSLTLGWKNIYVIRV